MDYFHKFLHRRASGFDERGRLHGLDTLLHLDVVHGEYLLLYGLLNSLDDISLLERFCNVIICADFKALQPIDSFALFGQENNWDLILNWAWSFTVSEIRGR